MKKKEKTADAPNIQFVGKRQKLNKQSGKLETIKRAAPQFVIDAGEKIELPADIEKGAYLAPETAARLIELFPNEFKPVAGKGGN